MTGATAARGAGGRLRDGGGGGEPMDLLDAGASRQLVRAAAGGGPRGAVGASGRSARGGGAGADGAADAGFGVGDDGRLVIDDPEEAAREAEAKRRAKAKRKRAGEGFLIDSDDSDFDDLRGYAPGVERALRGAKSVHFAPSVGGASARSGRTLGGRSAGGASAKSGASSGGGRGQQHSGERFKPKKGGAGGDAKGGAAVEPYAYWSFDRKMLNRRRGKQAGASRKLGTLVKAAQAGALKGAKAKRAAAGGGGNKRQKR